MSKRQRRRQQTSASTGNADVDALILQLDRSFTKLRWSGVRRRRRARRRWLLRAMRVQQRELAGARAGAWPIVSSYVGPIPSWAVQSEPTFTIEINVDAETLRDFMHEPSNRELFGDSAEGRELLEAVALLRARWDELDDDERASLLRTEALLEQRKWSPRPPLERLDERVAILRARARRGGQGSPDC